MVQQHAPSSKNKAEKPLLGIAMLMAARVTIDRIWIKPKCLRADEWLRKLRYVYTREYRPAFRKKIKPWIFLVHPRRVVESITLIIELQKTSRDKREESQKDNPREEACRKEREVQ